MTASKLTHKGFRQFACSSILLSLAIWTQVLWAQEVPKSVARMWNEALLQSIRQDFARPTVHARNLFHTSAAMYDIWAFYQPHIDTYFLGGTAGSICPVSLHDARALRYKAQNVSAARQEGISYVMYRILSHRFANSPKAFEAQSRFDQLMDALGYDIANESQNLSSGSPAALGNYLAACIINYGLNDGSNEANRYLNRFYLPVNGSLNPTVPGITGLLDPNRWQPLELEIFIDQAGNQTSTPPFLGAEWGQVRPFALDADVLTIYEANGHHYYVYHDPGAPALLTGPEALAEEYLWNHTLVARWSGQLDPTDGVICDISPASIGNTGDLPATIPELRAFYDSLGDGCSLSDAGYSTNPATGQPYTPQLVPRGDYTRVLAEFWADGPDSETPPGHWFSIVNEAVSDHPDFQKYYRGGGPVLDDLEWDVKVYFALGGAVHDAAISAWGIKGWYDYVRPVSAIRYMSQAGQSSDSGLPGYDPHGFPLSPGEVELVEAGDLLEGTSGENIGKVKLRAWRGPDYIANEETDTAGVGWILAENWWPYQRPTFVTPPFAGFISGHSTFSRAAAELLTAITGDPFFPGGMAEFRAPANEFLVFEDGPSVDVVLQWATYRDASDQTSLSRIWGGIHPPVDDIFGRHIGIKIGTNALAKAERYFLGEFNVWSEYSYIDDQQNPSSSSDDSGGGSFSMGSILVMLVMLLAAAWKRNVAVLPKRHLSVLFGVCILTACSGGGGGSGSSGDTNDPSNGNDNPPAESATGIFVDGIVSGLRYRTASQSGITDASGKYSYRPGEVIVFSVGDIELPSILARSFLTPFDLIRSANPKNRNLVNLARYLQSLDTDNDHSNGIQIDPVAHVAASGVAVDFNSTTFDIDVVNLVANSGGAGVLPDSQTAMDTLIQGVIDNADCGNDNPRVGQVAVLTPYHNYYRATATVEIINNCMILIKDLSYDGSGWGDVRFYSGTVANYDSRDYSNGIPISENFYFTDFDFGTVLLSISPNRLSNLEAISLWCYNEGIAYGHGLFLNQTD